MRAQDFLQDGFKPSILFLGSQMETGGAQRVLLTQAEWFHKKGYPVVVAFLYDKENLYERWTQRYDFPVINLRARVHHAGKARNFFHLLGGIIRLVKLVSVNNFDAIETFTHHSNLIGLPIAAATGIPIRIASHHGRINAFPHWLEWIHTRLINSKKTTTLVAVSEGVYKASIEEGIISQKIIKIPNGISIPAINQNAGISARSELGVPDDSFLILSVGRLSFEKGHIFLLESVPAVIERFPKTQFIIAGDGLLKSKLEAEADRLGVTDSLRFLGIRTDVPQLLAASDIFVLPSRSEGLPMALLEAMAMSVPVIATDVGGINQVVKNQVTGLLIPSEAPEAIAESINELLKDKSKRIRLARAAKEIVVKNYSMEKMCLEYERLFNGEEEL